jgi:hypothetical protein
MIANLTEVPAIRTYLDRVGAQARAMRTAVICECEGRYWRDIATIKLDQKGQISVSSSTGEDVTRFEPDDIERHVIAIAAMAAVWPENIQPLGNAPNLPEIIKSAPPENVFEFRNTEGGLEMIQLRMDQPNGAKIYLPFTYFEDQIWRRQEPDGLLPLWGIEQLKHYGTVFLHEGAKAARAMQRLSSRNCSRGWQKSVAEGGMW